MARRVVTSKGRSVRLEGLPDMQDRLGRILEATIGKDAGEGRAIGRELKRVFMGAALVLRDEARDLAPIIKSNPKNPKPWQAPGTLKSAIFASYGKDTDPNVLVGVNYKRAPQAHWIEFGTSDTPPQPYMRPALTATRPKCVAIIAEGFQGVIEKAAQ